MPGSLLLPLLKDFVPAGLSYGANYLVEFESQSLWYETSLTLAAHALRNGIKTDYHTFTHPPKDVRNGLERLGLNLTELERDDTFRLWDSYTLQTGVGEPERIGALVPRDPIDIHSLNLDDWRKGDIEEAKAGVPETDKRRLHLDDDTTVLLQFNEKAKFLEHWRTQTIPYARRHEMAALHSAVTGVHSESFYKQFESFCDGIIDFKSQEEGGEITHFMRVRVMRGKNHDSRWRRLGLLENGEVVLLNIAEPSEPKSRRLAAIMFTDIVGYTALAQTNETKALRLLDEHRKLLRPIFSDHGGREVKTIGDAFLVEFASALEATQCAVEIQRALSERNNRLPPDARVQARLGIHVGEVIADENDVHGDAVNVASRIEPLAEPGGICLTAQVYDHVRNKTELQIVKLGPMELKNIQVPVMVYKIVPSWGGSGGGSLTLPQRGRVAILPFTNISAEPTDEYFADGLTEELISTMSKIHELSVISRTSVMQYKNKPKPITEIGRELNAGTILEGSVRKAGNRVRISIQMIDANEDKHLWNENYDREIQDIFSIQSDIASRVADALKVRLLVNERREIERVPTKSPEAYTIYLKGNYQVNKGSPSDIERGIKYFELAIEQDPDFALAYAAISESYTAIADEAISAVEAFPKAKEYARRAIAVNERLAEAHNSLALIAYQYDWNWPEAEREFRIALELKPNLADGHNWYGRFLASLGRFDEAISEISHAEELDPLSPFVKLHSAVVYLIARKYDRAREICLNLVKAHSDFARAYILLAVLSTLESKYDEAIEEAEKAVSISDEALFKGFLGYIYGASGRRRQALEVLEGIAAGEYKGYASPFFIALVNFALGNTVDGFKWLENAFAVRSSILPLQHNWPTLDNVRNDPRFREIMRKMNL